MRKRVMQVLEKTTVDDRLAESVKKVADRTSIDDKLIQGARRIQQEVRKNIATAILAAFGFMIALVWRDVIKEGVTKLVDYLQLNGDGFSFTVITAFVTTVVCVIGILYFSRWSEKK